MIERRGRRQAPRRIPAEDLGEHVFEQQQRVALVTGAARNERQHVARRLDDLQLARHGATERWIDGAMLNYKTKKTHT